MDREYLENLEQRDEEDYEKFVLKKLDEGKFDFSTDRYPPDTRFHKLQEPVVFVGDIYATRLSDIWAQIPFSGSLIFPIANYPKRMF